MARMRSLKPEFWHDRKLARSCSREARMLYMGLWNHADEHARANADPRVVKGEVFPFDDDLTPVDIERLLKELAAAGRILLYEEDGDPFLFIPTLERHQRLEAEKVPPRHPAPPPIEDAQQSIPLVDQASEQPVCAPPESDLSAAQVESQRDPGAARAKHVHVAVSSKHVAGQPRADRAQTETDDGFAEFWSRYPRHKSKDAARKAWVAACKRAPAAVIIAGLERYQFRDEAQFIPYPATWLNQGRWEDEPDRPPPKEPVGAGSGRQPWQL